MGQNQVLESINKNCFLFIKFLRSQNDLSF